MTDHDRTDTIRYRLDRFALDELHIAVASPDLDEWPHEHSSEARLGWLIVLDTEDGLPVLMHQPEMLSLHTDTLDDDDFVSFMDILEMMMALHVAYRDMPDDERRARIDSEIYDANSKASLFLSAVEFAAQGGAP